MVVSSLVAGVDALLGPRLVLIGLLIAGPSCTLLSRRLKPTLASGAWAVALAVVLGIPDGIWASYEHLAFVSAVVVSAAVNVSVARVLEKLAARQSQTHYGSGNNSITER